MVTIRKATVKDLKQLGQFEQGIVETERPFDSTLKAGVIHYYDLSKFINAEDSILLVADDNGQILASGFAQIRNAQDYLNTSDTAILVLCLYCRLFAVRD